MNQHAGYERAGLWRRAAARAIDALVMVVIALLATAAAGFTAIVITLITGQDVFFSNEGVGLFYSLLVLLLVPGLFLVVRYEVASTVRRGRTFGKSCMGIRVAHWNDQAPLTSDLQCPDPLYGLLRWAVPHGTGMSAAVLAAVVAVPKIGGYGALVGAGTALAAWTVVYLSSLLDKDRRGWHDKAAGTIVVTAPDPQPQP